MSEMVNRVALAMLQFHVNRKGRNPVPYDPRDPTLDELARAAIEAMRHPTEAMILAAEERDGRCTPYSEIFRAMIDAGLK